MREYARILRGPAGSLLLVSGIARLAFGVAGLAFLVFVEEQTDSFATSGLAVGLFGATSALFAPLRGRFVDRYGAPALLAFTVGYAASNLSIPGASLIEETPDATYVVLSGVAGLVAPPFGSWTKATLAVRLDGRELESAYALDGALEESSFVGGPLIAGGLIAAGSSLAAVGLSIALALGGGLALAALPGLAEWRPARRPRRVGPAGPLPVALLVVIASLTGVGAAIGFLEIAVTTFAERRGSTGSAGITLAVLSASGIAGAVALGARSWRAATARRYLLLLAWFAAGLALLPLASSVVGLSLLIAIPGLALTGVFVTNSLLIGELSAGRPSATAFSGTSTALNGGVAIGAALAGAVVEGAGVELAFALAAGCAGLAAAVALPGALRAGRQGLELAEPPH